ncbi:MAG TPA: hypothetical protein VGC90_01515, partial [Candidatus Limnocylindrales bacterium]
MRSPSPDVVAAPRIDGGEIVLPSRDGRRERRLPFLVGVIDEAGRIDAVGAATLTATHDGGFTVSGANRAFAVDSRWSPESAAGLRDVELLVTCTEPAGCRGGLVVALRLGPTQTPRWLIPGLFYGENRPAACRVVYPRFAAEPSLDDPFESDRWSFRSDRAATPVVF